MVRPALPAVKKAGWVRNPIDALLLAKLESEGLEPAPPAERVALIRRLTYDLTGLPPTPEEVDAFVADQAADAYERLVDRLLASPHYGEAWGRHWLDLVRYAETNGYERDSAKPQAWRYRDYVIRAFNQDKPYDQFLREQLAGDEIDPTSAEALIATGFYRLGLWDDEPADRELAHFDGLDGIVSTAGQVFLGLSINCARCHDHKKDPLPQADYYRFLAFFSDVTNQDGRNTRRVGPAPGIEVMCVREHGHAETHVLLRGNPRLPGPKVEPGVPAMLGQPYLTFTSGQGKRRALADWLTDRRNPMTARVLVNRLWQFHFGRGLVPTPNDFGQLGEPALSSRTARLAGRRVHGGRLADQADAPADRAFERLPDVVAGDAAGLARDPDNRWFWRFPMRRLSAEEVRDSMSGGQRYAQPEGRWSEHLPADAPRGACRPVGARLGLGDLACPTRQRGGASTSTSSGRSRCRSWRLMTPPTPMRAARSATRRPSPRRRLACSTASSPTNRPPGSPSGSARSCPVILPAQVRRAIRLTTGADPAADEVARDVAWINELRHASPAWPISPRSSSTA